MRRAVVGVMGHVDHGKTALVRALTGIETDRLAEEKRRGISIALGFAHVEVGDALIDLIDMPGHERFVRTMISGATGTDAAMLVVAANEGVKPQTIEHLDVAALLGVPAVLVAVSKADLVRPGEADAVGGATAALVRAAGLRVLGQVVTSVATGQGLDALRDALAGLELEPPADDGFVYLPIDRAFSLVGHGTVATGTLRRGSLAPTDALTLVPDGRAMRLRGLQSHGARIGVGRPGQRIAVNLRDVAAASVGRGTALATAGLLEPARTLTVSLRSTPRSPALAHGASLVLLFGTAEIPVRLRLLEGDDLPPGGTTLAQLRCEAPVAVPAREPFILRRPSPPLTVAGGRIVDPAAPRLRRRAPATLAHVRALAAADPATIVALALDEADTRGIALSRLAQLAGLAPARVAEILPVLLGRNRIAVTEAAWDRILAAVPPALAREEVPLDRLAAALPWAGRAILDDAVAELVRRGALLRGSGGVRVPGSERAQAEADAAAEAILAERVRRAGLHPPDLDAIVAGGKEKRLADRLVRAGALVRTVDRVQKRELLFHHEAIEAAKRVLRPLLTGGAGVTVGEAGAALGISRKFCVPLLEHLDAIRFTRRIADRRVLATVD